ncbi:MAG TPA: multidrug effflux MFS transporter [Thermohalobaculum sp.]|nr:multidrug effflux MFS transporter [Thermohalobaculum sp.]
MAEMSPLPDDRARAEGRAPLALLIFLSLMTSVVALTIDAVMPALDGIAEDLAFDDANDRQLIILVVFAGMGVSQIAFGPLADGIGRKPAAMIGWAIFIAGTLLGMAATGPEAMLWGRFLQGLGAGGPRIVAMAIVRDLYGGRAMARVLSVVLTIFMLVPMLAPLVGQAAEAVGGWRAIFVVYLVTALGTAGWYWLGVPETLTEANRRPLAPGRLVAAFREVLTTRPTVFYTLAMSMVFAAFSVYLATAQQVLEDLYALGPWFPAVFSLLALAFALASFMNSRLVMRVGMRPLSRRAMAGLIVVAAGATVLTRLAPWGGVPPLWLFMVLVSLIFFAVALLFSNLSALALEPLGHVAGTASSVVMSVSTLVSVPIGTAVARAYDGSTAPLFTGFLVLGLAGMGFLLLADRARGGEEREAAAPAGAGRAS